MTEKAYQDARTLVCEAFNKAKTSVASHTNAAKQLSKANDTGRYPVLCLTKYTLTVGDIESKTFLEVFLTCLNRILLLYTKDSRADRLMSFIANFVNSEPLVMINENQVDLFTIVVAYILQHSTVCEKAVRFHCCQLMAELLYSRPDSAEISEDLWNAILASMLLRCRDRISSVRCQAVRALSRMQDPTEVDDPVTQTFIQLVNQDTSPHVRVAVLNHIAISDYSLPLIVQRTRDTSEEVRVTAYSVLKAKVDPRALSIQQRILLLRDGLKSRSNAVRHACMAMLQQGWLEGSCDNELVQLVKLLDVETNEEDVFVILKALFAKSDIPFQVDINELSSETAMIVKAKMAHYRASRNDEALESFIPSLQVYSDILVYFRNNSFVARQLFDITEYLDFGDEAGRVHCSSIMRQFLLDIDIDNDIIPSLVQAWHRCELKMENFVTCCCEVLHDIISSCEVEATTDYLVHRALVILKEFLSIQTQKKGNYLSSVQSFFEILVQPSLINVDKEMRQLALECLALYCSEDSTVSVQHIPLLLQVCNNDNEHLQIVAMKALFDILLEFNSFPSLSDADSQDPTLKEFSETYMQLRSQCISFLGERLTSNLSAIRTCAVEGFAKLILTSRVQPTPPLISCLFLLYFDPFTEEDINLRQCLSVFFPVFVLSSPGHALVIEQSFFQIIDAVLDAPSSKSLSEASVTQMAQYLLYLTRWASFFVLHKNETPEDNTMIEQVRYIHERICCALLNRIIDDPSGRKARKYSKILNFIKPDLNGQETVLKELNILTNLALEHITERSILSVLKRYQSRLNAMTINTSETPDHHAVEEMDEIVTQTQEISISQPENGNDESSDWDATSDSSQQDE
eukprot:jgi/Galph1/5528/GphlegSOOS_G4140.1